MNNPYLEKGNKLENAVTLIEKSIIQNHPSLRGSNFKIEPKKIIDLPKLVDLLRKVKKEDPSLKIEINEETGENLISGMGELHL